MNRWRKKRWPPKARPAKQAMGLVTPCVGKSEGVTIHIKVRLETGQGLGNALHKEKEGLG
jgi:hypothetical protein